jgi:hypothetical protein
MECLIGLWLTMEDWKLIAQETHNNIDATKASLLDLKKKIMML